MKKHLPLIFKGDSVQELHNAIQLIRNDKPVAAEKFRTKIIAVIDDIPLSLLFTLNAKSLQPP